MQLGSASFLTRTEVHLEGFDHAQSDRTVGRGGEPAHPALRKSVRDGAPVLSAVGVRENGLKKGVARLNEIGIGRAEHQAVGHKFKHGLVADGVAPIVNQVSPRFPQRHTPDFAHVMLLIRIVRIAGRPPGSVTRAVGCVFVIVIFVLLFLF